MRHKDEQLLSWLSFGVFLIIIGVLFLLNPNLIDEVRVFFEDFKLEQVSGSFYFPAPQSHHPTLYNSIALFCFTFGTYQIFLLILRIALEATSTKKVETFTSILFWLATGFAMLMLKNGTIEWMTFIAWLIILAAIIIIIRSIAYIAFRRVPNP